MYVHSFIWLHCFLWRNFGEWRKIKKKMLISWVTRRFRFITVFRCFGFLFRESKYILQKIQKERSHRPKWTIYKHETIYWELCLLLLSVGSTFAYTRPLPIPFAYARPLAWHKFGIKLD